MTQPICRSCGRWDTPDRHHPRCAERPAPADAAFIVERLRALLREWPTDAVPVIPLAELAAILDGPR